MHELGWKSLIHTFNVLHGYQICFLIWKYWPHCTVKYFIILYFDLLAVYGRCTKTTDDLNREASPERFWWWSAVPNGISRAFTEFTVLFFQGWRVLYVLESIIMKDAKESTQLSLVSKRCCLGQPCCFYFHSTLVPVFGWKWQLPSLLQNFFPCFGLDSEKHTPFDIKKIYFGDWGLVEVVKRWAGLYRKSRLNF